MNTSNPKLSPKPSLNTIVNTAQLEKNTTNGRDDNSQDDSIEQQPIRSIKSRIEQLTQQSSNNETNETTIINPNIKPYSNKLSFPNVVVMAQQQLLQSSSMTGESSDNGINGKPPSASQKFKNAVNALGKPPPPPIPSRSKPGDIKPIIPPSPSALMNNISPTLLHLPNSAPPQHSKLSTGYHNILDDDDPFDDSKEVDPFADENGMDNEPPPHHSTRTSKIVSSSTTSYSRPRRHSHTHAPSHVASREIRNKLIDDNSIEANSDLYRSSSQSVPSKPLRKSDNSTPNSSRILHRHNEDDFENKPSLPPRPQNKSDKQAPPPLPNRPQLPPRNPNTDQNNDKEEKKNKRQRHLEAQTSGSDSDPSVDRVSSLLDAPDATSANKRPPRFRDIRDINAKVTTRAFAIAGEHVITGSGHTRVWTLCDGVNIRTTSHDDSKVTSFCWRPTRRVEDVGRYIWCGAQDGYLFAIDIIGGKHIEMNKKAHNSQINFIFRHEFKLWTLDDSGKLHIWSESEDGIISLRSKPQTVKVSPKAICAIVVGHHLWLSSGKTIEIFNPLDIYGLDVKTIELGIDIGNVKCMTQTNNSSLVYVGHENGKITVWNVQTYELESTVTVSVYCINSLLGVGDNLWVGFKTGMIYIYNVRYPWTVIKDWQAHKAPVVDMQLDETGLWSSSKLQVASLSDEGQIVSWDGLMHEDWIADEMLDREDEYCNFREVKVLICSWNIDASKPADLEQSADGVQFLKKWFKSTESPDIIVVGFQEIIDLESKKMTAKTMLMTKKKADKQLNENITQRYKLWHDKLSKAIRQYTDQEYEVLVSDNLVGLFTCIFAKKSELKYIRDKEVAIKKTGLKGYHGNKGSIATRFIYDDSSICFVNCHLAAGQTQITERNTNAANILDGTRFPPNDFLNEGVFTHGGDGSMVLDHEIVFFSGDLNYRIDLPRDRVLKAIENKEYSFLFNEHDQLVKQRNTNPGLRLRSFSEGIPNFAPTYKYDPGEDEYDTSEKRRTPAWCDRILYFCTNFKNIKQEHYARYECKVSDHRPISGAFSIRIKTIKKNHQTEVKEEAESAWKKKFKEEEHKGMVKWLKGCGWDEQGIVRALAENYGDLRKAVDELSKKDGSGGGKKK